MNSFTGSYGLGDSIVDPDLIPDDFHGIDLETAVRLTPATLAFHITRGLWQPADHLLYVASIIARELLEGNAHIIVSMPPRHGKPINIEEAVLLADGTYKRLGDIQVGDMVISHTGTPRRVLAVHDQGDLPCVRINTRCGRSIVAALDHPFLTESGWKNAGDLKEKDLLAAVKEPKLQVCEETSPEEARLIGYFVGDGCVVNQGGQQHQYKTMDIAARIICHDPEELEDIYHVTHVMGFGIRHVNEGRYDLNGGVREWLRSIGLAGQNSHTKRVPEKLFKSSKQAIANFVGAYFATDGSVGGHKRRMAVTPLFVSANPLLLRDVQSLLLRLGIRSSLTSRWHKGGFMTDRGGSAEFRLEIMRRDDVERFAETVPIYGVKRAQLRQKMEDIYGVKRPQPLAFNGQFADDEVITVEEEGLTPCRCLTVDADHTFTVQDIVVHNSELISVHTPTWFLDLFPEDPIILATYGADLSTQFSRRVRDTLIELGGEDNKPSPAHILAGRPRLRTTIRSDVQQVGNFLTPQGGGMTAVGVGGPITGKGAKLLLIDDYIKNAEDAASPTRQQQIYEWFTSTAYTRLEPGGSVVILATRWDKNDLIGMLKANQSEFNNVWKVIEIPAIAFNDGTVDPLGRQPGEALWPERYPLKRLMQLKAMLGSFYWEAEFQQRPINKEDVRFEEGLVKVSQELPPLHRTRNIRSWDLAGSDTKKSDWTVGTLISQDGPPKRTDTKTYIRHQVRGRWTQKDLEEKILGTAEEDGFEVPIIIEQEPGSSGKNYAAYLKDTVLRGFKVTVKAPQSNKWLKAQPFIAATARGSVVLQKADWNDRWFQEFRDFPGGKNDDQVDSTVQGFNELYETKLTGATWGRSSENRTESGIILPDNRLATGATFGRRY